MKSMVIQLGLIIALVATAGQVLSSQSRSILAQIPLPPQSEFTRFTNETIHNDMPVNFVAFHSKQRIDNVVAFYRTLWSAEPTVVPNVSASDIPAYMEYSVGEWDVISTRHHNHSVVVQMSSEAGANTRGYISVTPLKPSSLAESDSHKSNDAQPIAQSVFLEATELSHTRSTDAGVQSDLRVFSSSLSVASALKRYAGRLRHAGWRSVWQSKQRRQAVLMMEKGKSAVEMMVVAADNQTGNAMTLIVVNEIAR